MKGGLKFTRLGQRVTTNLTLWHFGYGKGILTLAYAGQAITQGMAVSHKWISYFQRCLFTLINAHNPNQYKWGQQSLNIALGTIVFLGLWFSIAMVHAFITRIFIIEASCIHVCLKTLLFMNVIRYSFKYTSKPISLGLPFIHVCLKTLLFMNGVFIRYSFISKYIVLMAVLLVSGLANTT